MNIYLYGMICGSNAFLLDSFPRPDEYSEIKQSARFIGGETGTCATVLSSLGADVRIDGTHIGRKTAQLVRDFYYNSSVDISALTFDDSFEGLEDHVIISGECRTPMGTFGDFFSRSFNSNIRHWNKPCGSDIAWCDAAAIDACFADDSQLAAEICRDHIKPYLTIDCKYDSYLHRNSAVSVISCEGSDLYYRGSTPEELFPLYSENTNGLTIMTNGADDLYYGRKGKPMKTFAPYKVKVVSTLGAGDTFKAGCTYALAKGMNDDEMVSFASACAAVAVSRFPMQLDPPRIEEIYALMK